MFFKKRKEKKKNNNSENENKPKTKMFYLRRSLGYFNTFVLITIGLAALISLLIVYLAGGG